MITLEALRELSERKLEGRPVVSCYLDVDLAQWTHLEAAERAHRLVRQARIDVTRRSYTADSLWTISQELDHVVRLVGARSRAAESKGLAIFSMPGSVLRALDLPAPVTDCLIIGHAPYLKPLAALLDEGRPDGDERILLAGLNAAARESYGVTGVTSTLKALHDGRVEMLVVDCRLTRPGSTCLRCGRLFYSRTECPECGSVIMQVEDDLFDAAIRLAYRSGAEVSTVRRESIWPGMGAILLRDRDGGAPSAETVAPRVAHEVL